MAVDRAGLEYQDAAGRLVTAVSRECPERSDRRADPDHRDPPDHQASPAPPERLDPLASRYRGSLSLSVS